MTLGESRVRTSFNPSADSKVDEVKKLTANLIDICAELKNDSGVSGEEARLYSLAMTAYEEAAMWSVKALTINKT